MSKNAQNSISGFYHCCKKKTRDNVAINFLQFITDGDGEKDIIDPDDDGDGILDEDDPKHPSNVDTDQDGIPDDIDVDDDGDGKLDVNDEDHISNMDTDGDGINDIIDPDDNGDGKLDVGKNHSLNGYILHFFVNL